MLAAVPAGVRYYVTTDIDGFDPSIAPRTGTSSHGGFLYYEVMEMLEDLTRRGTVVGVDLVEVAPTSTFKTSPPFSLRKCSSIFSATSPPSAAFHKTRAASHGVFPAQYRVRQIGSHRTLDQIAF